MRWVPSIGTIPVLVVVITELVMDVISALHLPKRRKHATCARSKAATGSLEKDDILFISFCL